jgi:hypothetical protein
MSSNSQYWDSFKLKTIERCQMSIGRVHRLKNQDAEKASYRSSEFNLRAQPLMQATKEATSQLLDLIGSIAPARPWRFLTTR